MNENEIPGVNNTVIPEVDNIEIPGGDNNEDLEIDALEKVDENESIHSKQTVDIPDKESGKGNIVVENKDN